MAQLVDVRGPWVPSAQPEPLDDFAGGRIVVGDVGAQQIFLRRPKPDQQERHGDIELEQVVLYP